jgi:hypothetical protein
MEEARILGLQTKINGLVAAISPRFTRAERHAVEARLVDLIDALSGGAFRASPRGADLDRATGVQAAASGLIVALREAHGKRFTLRGLMVLPDYKAQDDSHWV